MKKVVFFFVFFLFLSPCFGKEIDINKKVIALTFDDGPSKYTKDIREVLNTYKINATFFLVGNKVNQYQEILKKLKQDGNCFGNHTYSHKWLSKEKKQTIKKEIENTNQVIEDTLNYKVRYFRPAYGAINKTVRKLTDLDIIFWNIDSQDWKVKNSKQIAYNIINHAKDEGIILMHDMYSRSVNALKIFIPYLQTKGYQFVTIEELEEIKKMRKKINSYESK